LEKPWPAKLSENPLKWAGTDKEEGILKIGANIERPALSEL
jgi:hypothetical protein